MFDIGGGASPRGRAVGLGYRKVTVLDLSEAALRASRERLGCRCRSLNGLPEAPKDKQWKFPGSDLASLPLEILQARAISAL
jgi:hypothetical protein